MLEFALNLLHRRRGVVTAAAVLLAIVGGAFMFRLSVNDSPERWMPASAVRDWERFAEHFEYGDTIAIGIQFHHGVEDRDIHLLRDLRRAMDGIEGVIRVTDISRFTWAEGATLTQMLAPPGPGNPANPDPDDDRFDLYRGVLFDDPALWRQPGTDDASRTLLMIVEIDASWDAAKEKRAAQAELDERRRRAMAAIYDVLDEPRFEREDVTYHLAGAVVIQYELEKIARQIVITLVPLAIVLTLLALGVGFRSMRAVWIALMGGVWAIIVMMGAVGAVGWMLNVVTVGGPILMFVIIIATTVHFCHYYCETGHGHAAEVQAARASGNGRSHFVRWVAVPCLGAAMTTGVGFLMLAFNELGPARELGFELFVGATLAFFGAYFGWLWLSPMKTAPGILLSQPRLLRLGDVMMARPLVAVLGTVVLLAVMGWATSRLRVDADPFSFFEPESHVAQALEHYGERKFGYYILDVILVPKIRPDDLAALAEAQRQDREAARRFQEAIAKRPEVRHVISETAMEARLEEWRQRREPALENFQPGEAARDVLNLIVPRDWPPELTLDAVEQTFSGAWDAVYHTLRIWVYQEAFKNWLVDLKGQDARRITFMVYDPDDDDADTGFRPLLDAARAELEAMPEQRFDYFFTGTVASVAILSEQLVGAMTTGLIAAMIAMATLCVFLFRSLRLTLIAFLPNAFPILAVFGIMGLFDVPLNSGSAMVATIALGVGLNDTIHFIMHYKRLRESGEGVDIALRETYAEIGRPIVLTSLVNCVGFSIFLLSDFRPMHHFGLLGAVAMLAALAGDLLLLPNLLKLFDRRGERWAA